MLWAMKRLIAPLLVLVVLAGCVITSRDATMDLPGTLWVLVDLDGAAPVGETPPTLAFDDQGGVTGLAGCNTFNGEVTIDGSDLTFGPLATTQMACVEEGLADQEQAFLAALQDATSYTIDDEGRLVLEDGGTLTFEVAAEAE
jgi:heat shock protein HslJ